MSKDFRMTFPKIYISQSHYSPCSFPHIKSYDLYLAFLQNNDSNTKINCGLDGTAMLRNRKQIEKSPFLCLN